MTQSWTTINDKGNSHHQHNHPNTILSCVYYAITSSGDFVIKTPVVDYKRDLIYHIN